MPDRLGESLNKNQEYFEKNLDKESYDFLVQLVESGKYSWKEIKRKVKVEKNKIIWKGKLDIEGTKVKKIKVKRIEGDVDAEGVESLEEIEVEEIGGDLNIKGTKVKKIKAKRIGGGVYASGVESLEEIEVEEIGGSLYIEGTKVKKIKAKRIGWGVNAEGAKSLEEIEVEEEIGLYLNIGGTNVKKIKAKKIKKGVNAYGVKSLEEIEVEEIGGSLDIVGTRIDFQLKVVEKIRNGELKVKRRINFGGKVKGIERLCEDENLEIPGDLDISGTNVKKIKAKRIKGSVDANGVESLEDIEVEEEIGGDLDIRGTRIDFQLKVIEKIASGTLEVKGDFYYNDEIISIFADKEGKLKDIRNVISFLKERYGESLQNIKNEGLKKEAINMLEYINSKIKEKIQTKIVEYANKGGKKEGEEKKLMIGKIMKKIVEYTNKGQEKEEIVKKIVGYSEEYEKWKKFYNKFMGKY